MTGRPRQIVVVGAPILAKPTEQVRTFDHALVGLVDDMMASMDVANGVGLAAPQVGVGLAVFVYDCLDEDGARHRGHVINPSIETSGDQVVSDEGCLSVPGPYHEVARAAQATVRGVDRNAAPVEVTGTGYFARCLQHETAHLAGQLYIDLLPRNRRRRVLRDMEPYEWNATS
ncbi:MAG: peptide deformylase [Jatrophihabitans sp.]